jgi:GT2 family glycosyltransferase
LGSVDIIIVTWNSASDIAACLDSIIKLPSNDVSVENLLIIDNGSADETVSIAKRYIDRGPVRIVENKANLGFARACNLGARESDSEYILFLNPDARLLADSLRIPVMILNQPSMTDVAVCGVQLLDGSGSPTHSVARFPTTASFLTKALGLSTALPRIFHLTLAGRHSHRRDMSIKSLEHFSY